jgi:Cu+-exporting ATPase
MSIMVSTGKGATLGALFKNAEAIEVMRKVDTLVVDKTGTLTEGKPKLVAVAPAEGWSDEDLLRLAASLERGSEHPLAAAIVAGAAERGVELTKAAISSPRRARASPGRWRDAAWPSATAPCSRRWASIPRPSASGRRPCGPRARR